MAEKRHLESVGTVSYSKLPRLEPELSQLRTAELCKSSILPGHASENYYSYKGSYFSYPLSYHEGSKPLTHWTPAEAYPHCTGSVANQQLQTEKALCMLYKHEAESFGARGQTLRHEKGSECISRDAFSTQERWASYMGHPGYVPQGWIHSYMAQQSPRAPTGCPTLAVPKPIYRHHFYSPESGYSPKCSLDLGMPVESTLKLGTEWALPPLGPLSYSENSSYGMVVPKKAAVAETNFLALPPGTKGATTSPAGFSPYRKSFEKCQGGQKTSFLDGSYPNTCSSQKTISEEAHDSNLSTHAWSKLPPPVNPMAHPPPLIYQDRSSTCYPLTSYPVPSHEQMLLYHQSYTQVEKPNSLLALPACKGFGSSGSEEPPILPGSYFPPMPRSYHPDHLESYPYKSVGPPSMTPGLQTARNQTQQQCSSATKVDTPQKPPTTAYAQPQKSPYCGSLSPRDWRKDGQVMEQTNKSFPSQQPAPQSEAFQPLSSLDQLPGFVDGFGQMQETICGVGLCPSEKAKAKEKEPSHIPKSSLTADAKKRNIDNHKTESGACIIIPDSPITPCSSSSKTDQAPNLSEDSNPSFQNGPQSPEGRARGIITIPEMPPPPSPLPPPPPLSPPMPVINNVFSLAPYRDYLEGSSDSVEIPLSKPGQLEEISPKNTGKSKDGPPSEKPNCLRSLEVTGEKDVANSAMAEVSQKEPDSNCTRNKREDEECTEASNSFQVKLLPPNGGSASSQPASKTCVNGWAGETEPGHGAQDLSSKMESLVDIPSLQRESSKTNVGEMKERPSNGQEVLPETNRQPSELPVQCSSEKRCNFQSSAAFLFKKFKIRKSQATEAGSFVQQNPSLTLLLSSQIAALPSDISRQQHAEQVATRQKNPILAHQERSQQNSSTDGQNPCQGATQQNNSPVQQVKTQQTSPPIQPSSQQAATQPETQLLQLRCVTITLPEASKAPSKPAVSHVHKKAKVLPPARDESPGQQSSPHQYFTDLHTSICTIISCSVSATSPEQLKEWLEKAESDQELKEKAASLAKPKNGVKAPNVPKPSNGKQVWLAFKDMVALFRKLLYQLDSFLLTHNCPFPHVVRAGTIFIPIHVVKEKLFPNLSGTSVDHVLQNHKVELRPTTLSEEKLLRDLELKSCTSRMLKLLALKQLPDIYPDLLTLHWHDCVKQQLGPSSEADLHASK